VTSQVTGNPPALPPEFEILRPLGEGAMGTVYLARETELRRLVAIKVPRAELALDEGVRARFEREAQAAARLRHPGIVAIHRIARLPDGTPYLVMEYVDGRTLEDILRAEGPPVEAEAMEMLLQVAEALAQAHSHGVIHRDVRPGNVLWVAEESRAVLTDFGIAGILDTGSEVVTRLTRPGELLGDPAYRSPEQLLGEPLTPAADSYGWGLLAFELLTGQRPYTASTPQALAVAHLRHPPRSMLDLRPELVTDLVELVERCLIKEPRHRPAARSLARALARIHQPDRPVTVPGLFSPMAGIPALTGFLAELRRRRVYNVALAYAAIAFVILQGAGLILPALPVPGWAYPMIVAATLAMFPVALVLAWMYDLTASGIRRAEAAAPTAPGPLRWILPSLGLLLSLFLAALIGWWVLGAA
jgi:serine/threonine protein kinase